MSSLSVAIVGLPNVGKSTLFNALLKKQQAYAANFPFATIEPNIGVVPVPDNRLKSLASVIKTSENMMSLPPEVPATVEFVDIAGLIAGAHKGEGLGNKFLSNIRKTNAILHVVRGFTDENIIREGSTDPIKDFEIIETELLMADHETLEKQQEVKGSSSLEEKTRWQAVVKLKDAISKGIPAREVIFSDEEQKQVKQLTLLTSKPILIAFNIDEEVLPNANELEAQYAKLFNVKVDQVIAICAKTEEELAGLSQADQVEYLKDLGVEKSGLERVIKKAFATLGLITFLTAGEKEVRAWTIKQGSSAREASGEIHTDFMKNFIKADVVKFEDFINYGGWKACREQGKVMSKGADYIVNDGEVIEFKIGT